MRKFEIVLNTLTFIIAIGLILWVVSIVKCFFTESEIWWEALIVSLISAITTVIILIIIVKKEMKSRK